MSEPQQTPTSIFGHYLTWIKAHEKLVILAVAAWLAFHFYGDVLNAWVEREKRIAIIEQQKVEQDKAANKLLTEQLADLKQQFAILSAQTQASMRKRAEETQTQKQRNDQSTLQEVAVRTALLLKVTPVDVTPSPINDTLVFSPIAAHTNVNALEDLQQAKADTVDLQKQLESCVTVTKKDEELIAGLNKELVNERASHKADVDLEKAKTKKAWRNGFKWGAVVGFIPGILIRGTIGR